MKIAMIEFQEEATKGEFDAVSFSEELFDLYETGAVKNEPIKWLLDYSEHQKDAYVQERRKNGYIEPYQMQQKALARAKASSQGQ